MNSVRRNAAWGATGALSVGLILSGLMGQPASSVSFADGSYPPTPPPTTSPPPTSPTPTTPTPSPRKPLPLEVKSNAKKKITFTNKFVTLIKSSKTNNNGVVKRRVICRPVKPSAAGEVSFCRAVITRKGGIKVKVRGYGKVKVTVLMTARPKAGSRDEWKPTRYRRTWILQGDTRKSQSASVGADVSLRIGAAS